MKSCPYKKSCSEYREDKGSLCLGDYENCIHFKFLEIDAAIGVLRKRAEHLEKYFPRAIKEMDYVEKAITSLEVWKRELDAEREDEERER